MNSSSGEFKSKWLQFCSFLHATRSLRYLGAEVGSDGLTYFRFHDPNDEAPNLEFQFSQGAQVAAIQLFGAVSYLRREISAIKGQHQLGEQKNGIVSSQHSSR